MEDENEGQNEVLAAIERRHNPNRKLICHFYPGPSNKVALGNDILAFDSFRDVTMPHRIQFVRRDNGRLAEPDEIKGEYIKASRMSSLRIAEKVMELQADRAQIKRLIRRRLNQAYDAAETYFNAGYVPSGAAFGKFAQLPPTARQALVEIALGSKDALQNMAHIREALQAGNFLKAAAAPRRGNISADVNAAITRLLLGAHQWQATRPKAAPQARAGFSIGGHRG